MWRTERDHSYLRRESADVDGCRARNQAVLRRLQIEDRDLDVSEPCGDIHFEYGHQPSFEHTFGQAIERLTQLRA